MTLARRAAAVTSLAPILLVACSGPSPAEPSANPLRDRIEAQVAELDPTALLLLRYNPTACNCPPFELRLGEGWVRAEWTNPLAQPAWRALLGSLANRESQQLPGTLRVRGRVDSEVLRTSQGQYAVRVEVSEVIEPTAPPPEQAASDPAATGSDQQPTP